ncbi:matrixin family metalloprotease [Arthrobacter sp. M4]|uniref:matrixin family metalloprotease n=1 Tax=Arthrobacter sp. M4 TaxID=218160 RepID=UPI001CDD3C21|nr:matrixin family metalloprotease [Arthrobacter sp. M4]MCA4133914.1 matrixin family metalloprotease [Arthrobacter sp. M4]
MAAVSASLFFLAFRQSGPLATLLPGLASGHGFISVPSGSAPGHADQTVRQPAAKSDNASGSEAPPPGVEEADAPLGHPVAPRTASNSYAFLAMNDDGTPVGYSPCRPLHYVVNDKLAPAAADGLIEDAVAKISRATGIHFVFDRVTDEEPREDRPAYQPGAYGQRWAPLLVSWTTPDSAPALAGDVIGTGGSTMYSFRNGPKSYVTGNLELDTPQIRELLQESGGRAFVSAVIQHELSHVMGLDHVDDPMQLMYPEIGAPDGLADGDLNGLYKLSKASCRKDL